jgi:DNA modification methylase
MKPVELVERALLNSSKAGDIVVDLFGDSGSTLVACERRDRKARLAEIDPRYADVIVRRWEDYIGKKATLDGNGQTFGEITLERAGLFSSHKVDCDLSPYHGSFCPATWP